MDKPRLLWIATLIATKLEAGGSIPVVWLQRELQQRHKISKADFHLAVVLAVARGEVKRTFGGNALSRARNT
jgi:hypothetical protein